MNNNILQLKIKQRLNKLASNDYDNIECWQIVEAFNKGMTDWCRRNLHGLNVVKEGDEASKRRIDDLQILLVEQVVPLTNKQYYYETTGDLPTDYFEWKRISVTATNECCSEPKTMVVYQAEEANVPTLLRDVNKRPDFEWGETFCTLKNNKVQIYTDGKFAINNTSITYYKQPPKIQIANCVDPYTGNISPVDVECIFKDDLVELFIDEAAKIIAGDIEAMNQYQRASQSVEGNN